jgi:hypothetical protein
MSNDIVPFKVRLPNELVEQVKGATDADIKEVVRTSVLRFLSMYATEQMVSQLITEYIERVEGLFEERFDSMTNLLASLSYVSKFNNNILNAIFVNNNGSEADLERFYNEATETVQKYFQFDENQANILPIMEENDQLKAKIQELEKNAAGSPSPNAANAQPKSPSSNSPANRDEMDVTIRHLTDQIKELERKKAEADRQKREVIVWINGLITHLVHKYSRLRSNEQAIRDYIKKNPKPKIQ